MSLLRRGRLAPRGSAQLAKGLRRKGRAAAQSPLRIERLEDRWTLSANPSLAFTPDQFGNEGSPLDAINFQFTDVVEGTGGGGGGAIGLNPLDFTPIDVDGPDANSLPDGFDPDDDVHFNTDTGEITGAFTGWGQIVDLDPGPGVDEIAVFVFSSFQLDDDVNISASGFRPLAILSQSDMTIDGRIDISAFDGDLDTGFNAERWAGPGGGMGGFGSALNAPSDGQPAYGAPANSVGVWNLLPGQDGAGTGGGHGGNGGRAQATNAFVRGPAGQAYPDLTAGVRGGSGGGTAGRGYFMGSGFLAGGGGGGGGIELGAVGTITISATGEIYADGGNGANSFFPAGDTTPVGGGGGGAGGGILIHGTNVNQHGLLSARGGDGGGGGALRGGGGGGGSILMVHSTSGTFSNAGGTQDILGGAVEFDGALGGEAGQAGVVSVMAQAPSASTPIIETFEYSIDWGDLTTPDAGAATITTPGTNVGDTVVGSFSGSHTYADDGVYTVTVTVTDNNGGTTAQTFTVTVGNVAPSLVISGATNVDEAGVYTLSLEASDPGDDTITEWIIDWGDGSTPEVVAGNPSSVTHTYADGSATYTITATATDEDGAHDANEFDVTVDNVVPTLAITGDSFGVEGAAYVLNLSSSDPGDDEIIEWIIDWGDGSTPEVVAGNPSSITHVYADNGNYTISATAADDDGSYDAGTMLVAVANVAPVLTISGDSTADEGAVYTLTLSSSDPGADTISEWTIDWGDGSALQVVVGNPSSVTHVYADGFNSYTISATATDEDGTHTANNLDVDVLNVAPALTVVGDANVDEASSYTISFSASDPGADVITGWTIDWGDGSAAVTLPAGATSASYTYVDGTPSSTYNIVVTATDEDGTYSATSAVTVLNVAPTADAGGSYVAFDDESITLSGNGSDVAGAADPLSYAWDLDNDGVFETSGQDVTFNPQAFGICGTQTWTVKLQVTDGDGGITVDETTVQIIGEGSLLLDGVLYLIGDKTANDIVLITQCGSGIHVFATYDNNSPSQFTAASVNEIVVRTRGGHDIVITTSNVTTPMTIDGGSGNDLLVAGSGNDVVYGGTGHDTIEGGAGDDMLFGGDGDDDIFGNSGDDVVVGGAGRDILDGNSGRDLIVGGLNEDRLHGGGDDDILIGGYTSHDSDLDALDAVMDIWTSAASFNARVASLTSAGGLLVGGVTVFDDDSADHVIGAAGRDLAFADNSKNWDGVKDTISLSSAQDTLIALN